VSESCRSSIKITMLKAGIWQCGHPSTLFALKDGLTPAKGLGSGTTTFLLLGTLLSGFAGLMLKEAGRSLVGLRYGLPRLWEAALAASRHPEAAGIGHPFLLEMAVGLVCPPATLAGASSLQQILRNLMSLCPLALMALLPPSLFLRAVTTPIVQAVEVEGVVAASSLLPRTSVELHPGTWRQAPADRPTQTATITDG